MKNVKNIFAILAMAIVALLLPSCEKPSEEGAANNGVDSNGETIVRPDGTIDTTLPDGTIRLNSCGGGIYFGDFWDEGIGDYYFLLTNDPELGYNANYEEVPMHPGGWLLFIDVWAALSVDHTNPIVPEGTYTLGAGRGENVMTKEFTIATNNVEKVETEDGPRYRIKNHFFQSGTLVVEHTEKGYKLTADYVTTEGISLSFVYEGPITMEDKSDDEVYDPSIKEDISLKPVQARSYLYKTYDKADNHVLMLFDVEELAEDNSNVAAPGQKLQLDLFNTIGAGLAGTYTVGTDPANYKTPGVIYPGSYKANMAMGSFVARLNKDNSVSYAIVKGGTVTITENGDGTHTVVCDLTNEHGNKITCNWTGVIADHLQ